MTTDSLSKLRTMSLCPPLECHDIPILPIFLDETQLALFFFHQATHCFCCASQRTCVCIFAFFCSFLNQMLYAVVPHMLRTAEYILADMIWDALTSVSWRDWHLLLLQAASG